jgi:putative ABC transport system ATP-binding protein
MVRARGVSRTYPLPGGQSCAALRGISLDIARGDYVAILGKSGSGKSTLLNLMAGLDRADAGELSVGGENLARLGENAMSAWRGTHLGIVFQFFQLLPTLTARENLVLAMELVGRVPRAERDSRAMALLDRVGLAGEAHKLPSTLSGGQQQRVAIARALANDPPLLIADEPTGNLDSETAADLGALFESLAREGKTLVVVTHDAVLARAAHRVVQLRDGQVVADEMAAAA